MKGTCSILALLLAIPAMTQAGVIFDNGAPSPGDFEVATISDADFPLFVADDFTLQTGSNVITDVHWTGVYAGDDGIPPAIDDFTIEIFSDSAGAPGSTLHSITAGNVSRADTGVDFIIYDIYSYSVEISPISLVAGMTYWLSIFNDTDTESDYWYWTGGLLSNAVNRSSTTDSWVLTQFNNRQDFQLTDDQRIPVPATLALLGLGLAGIGYRRKQIKAA